MAAVRFDGVGRRFGDAVALADFSLEVADGELVVVVGPSGCGKSTLLRVTAGLDTPTSGTITLDGRRIDALPPDARDVAMVFQSYALYPHLTVRGNVEFPLRMRGVPRAERRRRAEAVAELLEIGALLDRRPAALSGGQRQRVALARALVRQPKLFLLDEPLSNLDPRLRAGVRQYVRVTQRRLAVTTLYVTHDQVEAMTLGDRVVVLDAGRIQQQGPPLACWERPANTFVAGFLGTPPMNLVPAELADGTLAIAEQRVALPAAVRATLGGRRGPVVVGVRAEAFAPADGRATDALVARTAPGTVEALGSETWCRARVGTTEITVRLPGTVTPPPTLAAPTDTLHLFAAGSGTRLAP
jgi:ABC-type sugar transport system ATPase subunit